jgi:hypothetical protein
MIVTCRHGVRDRNLRTDRGFRDIKSRGEHRYNNRIRHSDEYNWGTAEDAEDAKTSKRMFIDF